MPNADSAWPSDQLGNHFRLDTTSCDPSSTPKKPYWHYSIPAWDATGGPILEPGVSIESNKFLVTQPCILVSKLNPRKPRVAVVEAPSQAIPCCASTEFMIYVPKTERVVLRYFGWYMSSVLFHRALDRVATGTTNSHVRVTPKETLGWRVPIPRVDEQRRIAEILDTADEAIRGTEALVGKLKAMKAGLLDDLLTRGLDEHGHLRDPTNHPEQFKDSPVGQIPRDWALVRVRDVLTRIEQGWSPDCDSLPAVEGEWGVLKTTAVVWEGYQGRENKRLPGHLSPRPELEVCDGDVLMTRGGPNSRVGVVAYVDCTRPQLMLSDKLYRLVPKPSVIAEYLVLALSGHQTQRHLSTLKTGLAESQTNISQEIVRTLFLAVPPRAEQRLIAEATSAHDARIRAEEAYLEKLKLQKKGLMHDLLTGRVRVKR